MKRLKKSADLKRLHIKNGIGSWMTYLEDRYEPKNDTGIPTGFTDLDGWKIFKRSNVLLLAGEEQASALCNSIALNIAKEPNANVIYFLTEGGRVSHAGMLLCADALVDHAKLRTGLATEEMWTRVTDSVERLAASNIYIDDRFALSLDEIEKRLKDFSEDSDISLVIVEGLATLNRQNRKKMEEAWDLIGIRLKKMAKKFNCVVVLKQEISFIYEHEETGVDFKCKEPQLTQLIEYKDLIREIDVVMFAYRESIEDWVKLIVSLNSSGICGKIYLGSIKGCHRLFDPGNMPSIPV